LDIAEIDHGTVRLHWTKEPLYLARERRPEVFVVLDGAVDMHYRHDGVEHVEHLTPGWVCYADLGDEHVAHPGPEARILVVERQGSA
jgi:mannose-6-phosphate isomerase-like protein (cupin superfamily)